MRTLALLCGIVASLSAADLAGVVVAEHDRTPIPAAAVTLRQAAKVVAELETDDRGKFLAANVPAGQYILEVKKSSFVSLERRITMRAADLNLSLLVVKQGVITGTVLDSEGKGVRNAVVAAIPTTADGRVLPGRTGAATGPSIGASTDSRGVFRVHGLPPGSYAVAMAVGQPRDIIASVRGILPDTSLGNNVQLYPSSSRPQIFTFRGGEEYSGIGFNTYKGPLFTIRGTVSGTGGGYRLALQNADVRTIALASASAAAGKGFEFTRVPPGAYRIVATSQQTYMQELPPDIVIPANLPPEIQIVEIRPGVRAVVGLATPGDVVNAQNIRAVGTPAEPTFGETTVVVGTQDVANVVVPTFRGVTPKFVYQPGEGCEPKGNLLLNPLEDWGQGNSSRPVQAGQEVTWPMMPPAPYLVTVNGTKCFVQQSEIDFRQASSDAIPVITLPYSSIKGKVKTTGLPADEYDVALTPPTGATQWSSPDAQANFAFNQLKPGKYRVSVYQSAGDHSSPVVIQDIDLSGPAPKEIEFTGLP